MTGRDDPTDVEPAWHERPSTLLGASVAALIVLAILFWGVSCVSQSVNEPAPAPQYYVDPSTSGSGTSSSSTSTTETITSTSPPVTTDIDPGNTSTSTTSTDTTTSLGPSYLPRTRNSSPSTYDDGRTRPRFNETRTLNPRP